MTDYSSGKSTDLSSDRVIERFFDNPQGSVEDSTDYSSHIMILLRFRLASHGDRGYSLDMDKTMQDVNAEGHAAYPAYTNPYPASSMSYQAWDAGYWQAHDESYVPDSGGIEEGYGDYYDMDAVSQGFYDDDPNPYDGTYSEM